MLTRTGFPEYVESLAIGPSPDFMRTQTDLCDLADEFATEVNAAYLWKKIATSVDPLMELREFTKHFLVDAPDFSEEYILHYVKKVNMLPPDLKNQIHFEVDAALAKAATIVPKVPYDPIKDDIAKRNFDKSRALQDDPSLLDKLANMMDSCKSSCNYFAPLSDKVGSIFDFSRMNSLNSSMPHDTELNAPPPTGLGLNIMNKIPRGIQNALMEAYTSAKLLMDAAKEQLTSPGTTAKLREFARQGVSADRKGVPFIGSTGSSLFQDALGLNSNLMTKVKRNMGDCFRIADFLNRYNAFDEEMNLAVARKKIFKLQIPDASLGGEKRTWSGTAQGVSDSDTPGGAPYNNNVTPQYALKPQTTGDARKHDDAVSTKIPCPPDTPIGQSPAATTTTPASGTTSTEEATTGTAGENGDLKLNKGNLPVSSSKKKNIRANNWGNLHTVPGVTYPGQVGQLDDVRPGEGLTGRVAVFDTPENGIAANVNQLQRYVEGKTTGKKLTTIEQMAPEWTGSTGSSQSQRSLRDYAITNWEKYSGIPRNQPIDPNNKNQMMNLQAGIMMVESGGIGPDYVNTYSRGFDINQKRKGRK